MISYQHTYILYQLYIIMPVTSNLVTFMTTLVTTRDKHIMLLKFPIILSSNFFLHLELFPEMKQLNMYFLF